jgi:MFS family permease
LSAGELLTAATVASVLGDGIRFAVLPLLALRHGANATQVAGLFTASTAPFLVAPIVGGVLADRVNRRTMVAALDLLRGVLAATLAILVLTGPVVLGVLYGAAVLLGILEGLYLPGLVAYVADAVASDRLASVNARMIGAQEAGRDLVGPVIGAAIFALASWAPFVIDALTFVASALLILRTSPLAGGPPAGARTATAGQFRRFLTDLREGAGWLVREPMLMRMTLMAATGNFVHFATLSVLAVFVLEVLHGAPAVYGALLTTSAAAGVAFSLGSSWLGRRLGTTRSLLVAMLLFASGLLLIGVARSLILAFAGNALMGMGFMLWNVMATTYRQRATPPALRGRTDGIFRFAAMGSLPLGGIAGGLIASNLSLRAPFVAGAALVAVVAVATVRPLGGVRPAPADA